ncbi:hypothetical protein C0991_002850, partial [Blastosporella zonata]
MFHSGSPYSPFFTSGLLSQPEPDVEPTQRRGSLPTSPFYFTLQPKRDTSEYRSFLSLDLAESSAARATSTFNAFSFAHNLTPPRSSLRLRHSRDSLRTIPSPKPAPSITLPDVPIAKHRTPSPTHRTPSPTHRTPSPTHSTPSPTHTASSTPPRLPSIVISASLGLTMDAPPPVLPTSLNRNSTVSTVSPSVRKVNRSQALARLEGRTNSTRRRKPIKRNFMTMGDESEGDDDDAFEDHHRHTTLCVLNEPEDLVLPPPAVSLPEPKTAPVGGRFPSSPRKQRTKDWFPLKSFIDFQAGEDDLSRWSWRSFIE